MKPLNHSFQNGKLLKNQLNRYREIANRTCDLICCRPEVAGDVISGENVKTIEGYPLLNFEVAIAVTVSKIFSQKAFRDGGGGGGGNRR